MGDSHFDKVYVDPIKILLINDYDTIRGAVKAFTFSLDEIKKLNHLIASLEFPLSLGKLTPAEINSLSLSISLNPADHEGKPLCNGIDCPKKIVFG